MSHKIENNMMAYVGETPWHGLGINVTKANMETLSTPEMVTGWLQAAGLDWRVQRRAIAMRDGQGANMLVDPLKGFKAIVRADTDQVFQVATDRYHPLQNQEIVEFFAEYCAAGNATLETLIGLEGGSKVIALAKLAGGDLSMGQDELRGYLMLATSHDGSMRTIGQGTQIRVVCWNTFSAALGAADKESQFRLKHSAKWSAAYAAKAREQMGMAVEHVQAMNAMAAQLSLVAVDPRGTEEFILRTVMADAELKELRERAIRVDFSNLTAAKVAIPRAAEAIKEAVVSSPGSDLPTAAGTLWGAFNGVTWYADHEYGRSQDTRLSAAWFGPAAQLKQRAMNVACEMAEVVVR